MYLACNQRKQATFDHALPALPLRSRVLKRACYGRYEASFEAHRIDRL